MKMKAIVCTGYGAPDVLQLQQVNKPMPNDNEVLVKIHTATATTAGLMARTGKPVVGRLFSGLTKPTKSIPGIEFAGEIEEIGKDVTVFEVGDPVFGMTGATTPGAYAEFKSVPEDSVMLMKPDNISYEDAAAIVEGGLTALNFLHHSANIQLGQKVLINGASGSVGTASVQVAKSFGAEVTAVCSATSFELVQAIGADHVIDYRKDDFTKNGKQYDIIFDAVGKRPFAECKGSLTPSGIYLSVDAATTLLPMLWTSLFGHKKALLAATYAKSAKALKADLAMLKKLAEAGNMQAVIDRTYPLEKTADAHRYVETGHKKGNVVITI